MTSKKAILITTAAALLLALTQTAGTGRRPAPAKLEGAWIAKVPGTPMQWNYVMAPTDPSGRKAALHGSLVVGIPITTLYPDLFPGVTFMNPNTPFVGQVEMTGPDTGVFSAIGQTMEKVMPTPANPFSDRVAMIWVTSGTIRFLPSGQAEITHHVSFYQPTADGDGDGLPDPGVSPAVCFPPVISIDTRVGLMPPCTPPPQ